MGLNIKNQEKLAGWFYEVIINIQEGTDVWQVSKLQILRRT